MWFSKEIPFQSKSPLQYGSRPLPGVAPIVVLQLPTKQADRWQLLPVAIARCCCLFSFPKTKDSDTPGYQ